MGSYSCSIEKPLLLERLALPSIEFCKIMALQRPGPPTFEHEDENENGASRLKA